MEKRLILFLVLSFAMIFLFQTVFAPKPPAKEEGDEPTAEGTAGEPPVVTAGGTAGEPEAGEPEAGEPEAGEPEAGEPEAGEPEAGEPETTEPGETEPEKSGAPRRVPFGRGEETLVDRKRVRWVLDSWGAGLERVQLKEFARKPEQDLSKETSWYPLVSERCSDDKTLADRQLRALALMVVRPDGGVVEELPLDEVVWDLAEAGPDRVVYRLDVPFAGVALEKAFSFPEEAEGVEGGAYHVRLDLRLTVTDEERAERFGGRGWTLRLRAAARTPIEPFSRGFPTYGVALTTDMATVEEFKAPGSPDSTEIAQWPEAEQVGPDRAVAWTALRSRFFGVILRPLDPKRTKARRALFVPVADRNPEGDRQGNYDALLDFPMPLPAEGNTVTRSFLLYAGPLDPDLFDDGAYASFEPIITYGFFGFIARILVFLLGVLRSIVGGWGIAIIVLTLLVRGAIFPLSRKSQLAMQRYQKQMMRVKPKLDELKKRYAKNRKKLNEEMMKLYREEGVRVFPAGCLIMFLQLPIFIGLFQALRYSIGLRHAAFLWAPDLTAPDRLMALDPTGSSLIPDYLNVFPIIMGVTWYLSSAMAPKPADPQQAQTMKMMKWMPIIFSLMLYNYPAGLALYMVVSSSWSIFETKVVRKILAKGDEPVGAPAPTFRKGK